jgi:hypothetical protein
MEDIVAQKSEKTQKFLPQVSATNPTLCAHHRPYDHLRTTVHHYFDPLGADEMVCMLFLGHLAIGVEDDPKDPMKLFLGHAMLFVGSIWKNKSG